MPELGGLEFLVKSDLKNRFPETKIIILTNAESPKLKQRALELGADQFLIKVECTPYGLARSLTCLWRRLIYLVVDPAAS